MTINCIAVDDEPLALDKMKEYIGRVKYLNLLGLFGSGVEAVGFLRENRVDLIFLDIQMDDLTGIQLLEAIPDRPAVILTTAYDSYALKGYELEVIDYLLKPISFQRFIKAVDRVHRRMASAAPAASVSGADSRPAIKGAEQDEFLFVKTAYRIQQIRFEDILFIEGMKDYLRIWTVTERIMTLQSFNRLMEVLPPERFIRVHKSFVIALDKISSIERNTVCIGDQRIPVGETYRKEFFSRIAGRKHL
ncbi:MAG: response regulator transcription factor [Bacteroidales bacterium]|nr:response regulator transcription factor [Bacteroidales bacterium]